MWGPPTSTWRGGDSCASCSRRANRWEAKLLEKISAHKVGSRPKVLSSEAVTGLAVTLCLMLHNVSVHRDFKTRNVFNEKPSLMNPRHWEMPPAASYTKVLGERETQDGFRDTEPPVGYKETNNVQVIGAHTAH